MNIRTLTRFAASIPLATVASLSSAMELEAIDGFVSNAGGKIETRVSAYADSPSSGDLRTKETEDADVTIEGALFWNTWHRFEGGARIDIAGWFEYGSPHDQRWQGGFEPWQDDKAGSRPAVLNEVYLSVPIGDLDLTVGKTYLPNSIAGLFSPADRYTPADYNDPTESKDLGTWQLKGDYHADNWTATIALLPVFQPSKFPLEDSRWFVDDARSITGAPMPPGGSFVYSRDIPEEDLNVLASLRTRQSGWDAFVSAYYGYSRYPVFALAPGPAPGVMRVTQDYIKGFDLSAGVSATRGLFEFHAEGLYFEAEDGDDDSYLQGVFGVTYRPESLPEWLGCNQIVITIDYAGELRTEKQDNPKYAISSEPFRFGRNTLLAEAYVEIDARNEVTLNFIQDFEDETNAMARAEYSHRFDNGITAGVAGEIFSGDGLYFGDWSSNDRVTVFAEYDF